VAGAVRRPGDVFRPGQDYAARSTDARAEGLSADAGAEILISRPARNPGDPPRSERIPVKGLIETADPEWNVTLEAGKKCAYRRWGRVVRGRQREAAGGVPDRGRARNDHLQALALAEGTYAVCHQAGFHSAAWRRNIADGRRKWPVELRKILDRKSPDVPLAANDILYIPDNRSQRTTLSAIEKAIGFATATRLARSFWAEQIERAS